MDCILSLVPLGHSDEDTSVHKNNFPVAKRPEENTVTSNKIISNETNVASAGINVKTSEEQATTPRSETIKTSDNRKNKSKEEQPVDIASAEKVSVQNGKGNYTYTTEYSRTNNDRFEKTQKKIHLEQKEIKTGKSDDRKVFTENETHTENATPIKSTNKNDDKCKTKINKIKERTLEDQLLQEIDELLNEELEYGPYSEETKLHSLLCNRPTTGYACGRPTTEYTCKAYSDKYSQNSLKRNERLTGEGDGLYEDFKLPYNRDLLERKGLRLGLRKQSDNEVLNYSQQFWWKVLSNSGNDEFQCSEEQERGKNRGRPRKKHALYGKENHKAKVNYVKLREMSPEIMGHKKRETNTEIDKETKRTSDAVDSENNSVVRTVGNEKFQGATKENVESQAEIDVPGNRSLKSPRSIDQSMLIYR